MTSTDSSAEFQAALWEAGEQFGVHLDVSTQVAIAGTLARIGHHRVSPSDVRDAFVESGLARPSNAFANDVLSRVKGMLPPPSIRDVLLDYRHFVIDALSAEFGGHTKANEERLRNNLRTYLPKHGFAEARTGKGRTDIAIPPPEDAVIEVKVWTSRREYEDGLEELRRYINTHRPKQAYMVVFGDREPLPAIVDDHTQAIAEERQLEELVVPVIVVPFEVDAPSKAGRAQRRRARGGR